MANKWDVQLAELTEQLFGEREERGISLDQLARKTVMGPGYLGACERGDKELPMVSMLAYGRAVGLRLALSETPDGPDLARRLRRMPGDGIDEHRLWELVQAVREARDELELSQYELATSAAISQPWVAQIENRTGRPAPRTLLRLAGAVNCTVGWRVSPVNQGR